MWVLVTDDSWWVEADLSGLDFTPSNHADLPADAPIVVVCHGITGGSHESYVKEVLAELTRAKEDGGLGARGVVVNVSREGPRARTVTDVSSEGVRLSQYDDQKVSGVAENCRRRDAGHLPAALLARHDHRPLPRTALPARTLPHRADPRDRLLPRCGGSHALPGRYGRLVALVIRYGPRVPVEHPHHGRWPAVQPPFPSTLHAHRRPAHAVYLLRRVRLESCHVG